MISLDITQNTLSPFANDDVAHVLDIAPTTGEPTPVIHWNPGDTPPVVVVAVKVTNVPSHTVSFGLAVIETETGVTVFTTTTIELVADGQPAIVSVT